LININESKIPAKPLFCIEISRLPAIHREAVNQGVRKFDTLKAMRRGTTASAPGMQPALSIGISDERRGSKARKKEQ
jgi:hypothetical protein